MQEIYLSDMDTSLHVRSSTPKIQRLIDWNVIIFQALLEEIVAQRHSTLKDLSKRKVIESITKKQKHTRDKVMETVAMPNNSSTAIRSKRSFKIDPKIVKELRDYITRIGNF